MPRQPYLTNKAVIITQGYRAGDKTALGAWDSTKNVENVALIQQELGACCMPGEVGTLSVKQKLHQIQSAPFPGSVGEGIGNQRLAYYK